MKKTIPPIDETRDSRRDFLKKGAMATAAVVTGYASVSEAAATVSKAPAVASSILGANDRLVIGFVGVGGQGFHSHLQNVINRGDNGEARHDFQYNAAGVAACDLFSKRRDRALAALNGAQTAGGSEASAEVYEDYRALIDRQDIDAIFIGAVDHWHADIAIDAMQSGKHVYCEKPMTRYLDEAFRIYDTVKETGKKFQVGSQYCTEGKWHLAADLVRQGKIGKLVMAQDSYMRNTPSGEWNYYEIEPELQPGVTIDWEKWLGHVGSRPFNAEHYHRWRKYYPYCAGILGDLLAHRIHPLLIGTGNPEFPMRVVCLGNKKVGDEVVGPQDRDVPDNIQLLAEFPSGLCIVVTGATVNEQGLPQVIRGNEATLVLGDDTLEMRPERPFADLVDQELHTNLKPGPDIPAHIDNFFTAIREDGDTNGNIEIAVRAQAIISMAEMSERLGEMIHFDEKTRTLSTGSGKPLEPITYGTFEQS